jgi:hypothetical protein
MAHPALEIADNVIGGRSLCETQSISDLAEIALAAGVVTSAEIRKAKS